MGKHETKFNNAAVKMNQALIDLLYEKDFNKISISEICAVAGVNRSTFYAHYINIAELLNETKKAMIASFMSKYINFGKQLNAKDYEKMSLEDTMFITPKYVLPYLSFIKENKKIFKVYTDISNSMGMEDQFKDLLNNLFLPILTKYGFRDINIIDYMSRFYVNGITAIVTNWVKKDCVDDEMLVCEIINMCIISKN